MIICRAGLLSTFLPPLADSLSFFFFACVSSSLLFSFEGPQPSISCEERLSDLSAGSRLLERCFLGACSGL